MSTETEDDAKLYRGEALIRWFPHNEILERAVIFEPGYDDDVPGRYGRHGMEIRWLLRGPRGAVQFLMNTGWVPGVKGVEPRISDLFPMATDIGYHAKVPQYEGAEEFSLHEKCDYIGGKCYYDGSGLQAEEIMKHFIVDGEKVIWAALEARYSALEVDMEQEDPEGGTR